MKNPNHKNGIVVKVKETIGQVYFEIRNQIKLKNICD